MSYYKTCPLCGAHLDPGEKCDCVGNMRTKAREMVLSLTEAECREIFCDKYSLLTPENRLIVDEAINTLYEEQENAAPGAANTGNGKAEQSTTAVSASIVTENKEDCKR